MMVARECVREPRAMAADCWLGSGVSWTRQRVWQDEEEGWTQSQSQRQRQNQRHLGATGVQRHRPGLTPNPVNQETFLLMTRAQWRQERHAQAQWVAESQRGATLLPRLYSKARPFVQSRELWRAFARCGKLRAESLQFQRIAVTAQVKHA